MCRVLLALEYTKTHLDQDIAIISLDAEKAFDNISFPWLFRVTGALIFSGPVVRFLQQINASQTACLVTLDKGNEAGMSSFPSSLQYST